MDTRNAAASPLTRTVIENDKDYTVTKMRCLPCEGAQPHDHYHKQVIYILRGSGTFARGDERIHVTAGDHLSVPSGVPHTFVKVDEEMEWLEFFTPGREDF